ncbi:uncharacterized protein [Rhodnius prolixus]
MNSPGSCKQENRNDAVFSISSGEEDVTIIQESKKQVFSVSSSSDESEVAEFFRQENFCNSNKHMDQNNKLLISSSDELSDSHLTDDISLNVQSDESDCNVSDVITGVTVEWNNVTSPGGWTKQMRKYYNKPCKRQRYFDWKKVLQTIRAGSPSRWRILQEDIHPVPIRRRRCLICRQSDHLSKTCPRKYRICIMCGVPGHLRFNCPQSKCLNCGAPSNHFNDRCGKCYYEEAKMCQSCKRYGHAIKNCPDIWRRFHCTIVNKEINTSQVELNKNIQCCNCAKPGHMFEQCPERYWTNYSPTSFIVTSYNDNGLDGQLIPQHELNSKGASSSHSGSRSYLKRSRKSKEYDSGDEQSYKKKRFFQQNEQQRQKPRYFLNNFSISNPFDCFNGMIRKRKSKRKKKKTKNSLHNEQNLL